MQVFKFLSRHPFDDTMADAYADGELDAAHAERFEEHLHSCQRCSARVAAARAIRRAVASLPEVAAPRSFAITPEVAAAARPAPSRRSTPVYVNLARAGAALSVAAFGAVLAVNTFESSDTTSTAAQDADTSAALGAPISNESAALDETSASPPTPVPTLGLAPAAGGDASGSGGSTVVPVGSATAASAPTGVDPTVTAARTPLPSVVPEPPATGPGTGDGQYSSDDSSGDSRNSTVPESGGVITDAVPAEALVPTVAANGDDEGESNTALWVMGAVAVVAVGALAVLEITRRRRSF